MKLPSHLFYNSFNKTKWTKLNSCFFTRKDWKNSKSYLQSLNVKNSVQTIIASTLVIHMLVLLSMDVHTNPGPNWSDLTLCHSNIRSLRNCNDKLDHIRCNLADNYDIITISETWLHDNISSSTLNLSGFQSPYRKDRIGNVGYGGVLTWVSIRIAAKRRTDLELDDLEAMWLEIRCHNNKFLLCVLYRAPNSNLTFWDKLQESVDLALDSNIKRILITGDINADPQTPSGHKLKLFTEGNLFTMHITEPTRITPTSATVVDQFISNFPQFIQNPRVDPPISSNDHCNIGIDILFRTKKVKAYKRTMWDFKNCDFTDFVEGLQTADFNQCYATNNTEEVFTSWNNLFLSIAKNTIPNKEVTVRPNDKPWFNGYLRRLLRKKNRIHNTAKNSNSVENWEKFKEARNFYFNEIRRLKRLFEESKYTSLAVEGKSNPKKWWTILRQLMDNNAYDTIPPLDIGDKIVVDNLEKAEAFNTFFSKASALDETNANLPILDPLTDDILDSITITVDDVKDQLISLDTTKAYGPDGISPVMLKAASPVLIQPLAKLINYSSHFPTVWKSANIITIHKKDE